MECGIAYVHLLFVWPCITDTNNIDQCISAIVTLRPGKFFFHKTRAWTQQIYS